MSSGPKVLLYSNRLNEIDEYAQLVKESGLELQLDICRTPEEAHLSMPDAEIVFGVHLPAQVYSRASRLKWIQSMWAGVEGLLPAPVPESVRVTRPWGVFGGFLSQYVFAYLLADRVKMLDGLEAQKQGVWSPYRIESLRGKIIGIAGFGNIGADIAGVASAFGMRVWGLNSDGRPVAPAERMFSVREIEDFVAGLDVAVLVLPCTPDTRGLFGRKVLSRLKSGAVLINVGRGTAIDDAALVDLLASGHIHLAVLDVFSPEPLPADSPYWTLPNCRVTPHVGGPSLPEDITACFVENFKRYQRGEPLKGEVDRQRGY